jgi:hypothetical protein
VLFVTHPASIVPHIKMTPKILNLMSFLLRDGNALKQTAPSACHMVVYRQRHDLCHHAPQKK